MKRKLLALLFFTAAVGHVFAQKQVSGKITSGEDGSSLPGVNVVVEELKIGAASDVDGRFRISRLAVGKYTLVCSAIGFRTIRLDVSIDSSSVTATVSSISATNSLAFASSSGLKAACDWIVMSMLRT